MKFRNIHSLFFVFGLSLVFLMGFFLGIDDNNEITKDDILNAEKIIGLKFNDVKRDSMLDELKDNLKNYNKLRELELPNNLMPAILFNPIPKNFKFETKQAPIKFEKVKNVVIPLNLDDAAFYSITELAFLLKNRKVTSTELTKMYLSRLKKYGPILECVVTLTEDLALRQAKRTDEEIASGKYRGLLHGIPHGIKDLFATRNYKTPVFVTLNIRFSK